MKPKLISRRRRGHCDEAERVTVTWSPGGKLRLERTAHLLGAQFRGSVRELGEIVESGVRIAPDCVGEAVDGILFATIIGLPGLCPSDDRRRYEIRLDDPPDATTITITTAPGHQVVDVGPGPRSCASP